MSDLNEIRQLYPDLDKYGYTDAEVVNWMAGYLDKNPQELAIEYGVIDPNQGDFARGISSGVDAMQGGYGGLVGLAGESLGIDSMRDYGYRTYTQNMDLINLRSRPTDNAENVNSIGDAIDFAQYYAGYALPQIAEAIVGSKGAGAAAGQGARQVVKRNVAQEAAERGLQGKAVDTFARRGLASQGAEKAIAGAAKTGQYGYLGTSAFGQELGHTYGGAADEQGVGNVDLTDVSLYGGLAGGAEFGADVLTLGLARLGPAKNLMDSSLRNSSRAVRMGTRGGAAALTEGTTEVVQTGLEVMGAGKSFEEANFSDPTSFFAGAIGGGGMGLVAGAPKTPPSQEQIRQAAEQAKIDAQQQAQLEAQQLAQEEAARVQAEAQARAESELLDKHRYNGVFPTEAEYRAERTIRRLADLDNVTSELGAAFKEWRVQNQMYDIDDKSKKAFLKQYGGDENEIIRQEYLAQLKEHADYKEAAASRDEATQAKIDSRKADLIAQYNEAVASGDFAAVEAVEQTASQELLGAEWREAKRANELAQAESKKKGSGLKANANKGDTSQQKQVPIKNNTASTNAPNAQTNTATNTQNTANATDTNAATAENTQDEGPKNPYRQGTKKFDAWNQAAEALGEDWEANHPELSVSLANGNHLSKGKRTKKDGSPQEPQFFRFLREAIREKSRKENEANAPVLNDDATAGDLSKQASDFARQNLGMNWEAENPQLASLFEAGKWKEFQDGVVQTKKDIDAATEAANTVDDVAANLTDDQRAVFDLLRNSIADGTIDDLIQQDNTVNHARVAEKLGWKMKKGNAANRQRAYKALKDIRPKVAKLLGRKQEDVASGLKTASRRGSEGFVDNTGLSPEMQTSQLEGNELEGENASMRQIRLTDKDQQNDDTEIDVGEEADIEQADKDFAAKEAAKPDAKEAERLAKAEKERKAMFAALYASPQYKGAKQVWENFESDLENEADRISLDDVDGGIALEWTQRHLEFESGNFDVDALADYQNQLRQEHLQEAANAETNATEQGQTTEGQAGTETTGGTGQQVLREGDGTQTDGTGTTGQVPTPQGQNTKVTVKKKRRVAKPKAGRYISTENDEAFTGFTTAKEAVQHILDNGTESEKILAERIMPLLADVDVQFRVVDNTADIDMLDLAPEQQINENPREALTAAGERLLQIQKMLDDTDTPAYGLYTELSYVDSKMPQGIIHVVNGSGTNNQVILHELMHAATAHAIYAVQNDIALTPEQKVFVDSMEQLLKLTQGMHKKNSVAEIAKVSGLSEENAAYVKDVLDNAIADDIHEFVAYGFTDPQVQQYLMALKLKDAQDNRSVFQRFVDAVKGLLGITKEQVEVWSALDGLVNLTDSLMENEVARRGETTQTAQTEGQTREAVSTAATRTAPKPAVVAENVRKWTKDTLGDKAAQFWDDTAFILKNASASTKFLHQFIRDVKDKMPSAARWYDAMKAAEKTRNDIRQKVESIAVRAREMEPERLKLVNKFIADSTFFQLWGYTPAWKTQDQKFKTDPIMESRFKKLSADEQQLVKDIFTHGEEMKKRKQDIAKNFGVKDSFFTGAALDGPYAPLKRFGNHAAELKSAKLLAAEKRYAATKKESDKKVVDDLKSDQTHYVISFFDTPGAARKYVEANKANYATGEHFPRSKDVDTNRAPNHAVYAKVLGALNAGDGSGLSTDARDAFASMIRNMYFQSLDESNARLSGARRKNRAGFEENMVRSFLHHATAEAALISSMEHGAEINAAFIDAGKEASSSKTELAPTYEMIKSHYKDVYTEKETPWQDRIAAANTVYMLTTSIGYHVTNATQPAMVTVPKLAGDFGDYSGAWGALFRGYKTARKVIGGVKGWQANIDVTKADPKYRKLLEEMNLRQLLDVGIEQDLSEFNRFDSGYGLVNKITEGSSKWVHRLYQIARVVEAYNRVSSATAAYDLALKNANKLQQMGMTAEEYAVSIVEDTQGNFSRMDAPLLLKKLPKVTVQYRKYQFMMAWVYSNAFKQAFAGDTVEERAMGRRTMAFALSHAGIFAGATGIPLLGSVASMFLAITGDGDEPEDFERWIRRNVGDDMMADILTRGIPTMIGIDMSTKLSQAKIFSPVPYSDLELTQDGMANFFFDAVSGPAGTTGRNFVRAAEYAGKGDLYRAIESSLPKGFRTVMESYRLGTEGYGMTNGDIVADPSKFNLWSLAVNALGIPATEINKIKWTRGQQFELEQWFSSKSGELRRDYVRAYKDRDSAKMEEIRSEWRELQDSKDRVRPFFNGSREVLKRQSVSELYKAPAEQRKREQKMRNQLDN